MDFRYTIYRVDLISYYKKSCIEFIFLVSVSLLVHAVEKMWVEVWYSRALNSALNRRYFFLAFSFTLYHSLIEISDHFSHGGVCKWINCDIKSVSSNTVSSSADEYCANVLY